MGYLSTNRGVPFRIGGRGKFSVEFGDKNWVLWPSDLGPDSSQKLRPIWARKMTLVGRPFWVGRGRKLDRVGEVASYLLLDMRKGVQELYL